MLSLTLAGGTAMAQPAGATARAAMRTHKKSSAQTSSKTSQDNRKPTGNPKSGFGQSFEEFRTGIRQDFDNFKGRIFDHYADFLEGEWHAFESQLVPEKYSKPKPKTPEKPTPAQLAKPSELTIPVKAPRPDNPAPISKTLPTTPQPISEPEPEKPAPPATPAAPAVRPGQPETKDKDKPKDKSKDKGKKKDKDKAGSQPPKKIAEPAPEKPKEPVQPEPPAPPVPPVKPAVPETPVPAATPGITAPTQPALPQHTPVQTPAPSANAIEFYGMAVEMPPLNLNIANTIANPDKDFAVQWRNLSKDPKVAELVKAIGAKSAEMGLNSYLTFRLAESTVAQLAPKADAMSQVSAVHYIMNALGNDFRIGYSVNGHVPLYLMPFDQIVYGSTLLTLGGRNYTAFMPTGMEGATPKGSIATPVLPTGGDHGKSSNLKIHGLRLPYKPHHYKLTGGGITIEGDVNENLFKMLYKYPQMPTEDFASSVLDDNVRREITDQVNAQLAGKPEVDAVNQLMSFFHQGFKYATDQERHGFEKPYFLEENLYYDRNDCEDRAIFFTYLLWNALGKENMLIAYPGHESAAVHLGQGVRGTVYTVDGVDYYSADPTYIGSNVGMCGSAYKNVTPTVDKLYK